MIGLNGGVGSTVATASFLLKRGYASLEGLPLASTALLGAAGYDALIPAGWDISSETLKDAVERNAIVDADLAAKVGGELERITPWAGLENSGFTPALPGANLLPLNSYRSAIETIRARLDTFQRDNALDEVVVINLASTERAPDLTLPCFATLDDFERALDANDPAVSASMIYAYAAVGAGRPYSNFTPSCACDIAPIEVLARTEGVPIAGKDGKTGQTLLKTVIAPALRDRALRVDSWYSTNLLGNLDGHVLSDEASRRSKISTKQAVLNSILGYSVEDHRVDIVYCRSKGDEKEAWDSIDLTGFLGKRMQIKLNFLCADSILAAPLVIELARLLDFAKQKGCSGAVAQLGVFFKSPQVLAGDRVNHDFAAQQADLRAWIEELSRA